MPGSIGGRAQGRPCAPGRFRLPEFLTAETVDIPQTSHSPVGFGGRVGRPAPSLFPPLTVSDRATRAE